MILIVMKKFHLNVDAPEDQNGRQSGGPLPLKLKVDLEKNHMKLIMSLKIIPTCLVIIPKLQL